MKKKKFDAVGWKSYCNTKKKMLYCGAGRAGAGRAGRVRGACVLGVQGARGMRACVGHTGVARRASRRHGRWAARAQARRALKRAAAGGVSVRGRADRRRRADGRGRAAGRGCAAGRGRAAGRADGRQRRAGRAGRAQQGRQAHGLGAWVGQDYALGAPDLIFKPVFDSVFFLSQ